MLINKSTCIILFLCQIRNSNNKLSREKVIVYVFDDRCTECNYELNTCKKKVVLIRLTYSKSSSLNSPQPSSITRNQHISSLYISSFIHP